MSDTYYDPRLRGDLGVRLTAEALEVHNVRLEAALWHQLAAALAGVVDAIIEQHALTVHVLETKRETLAAYRRAEEAAR